VAIVITRLEKLDAGQYDCLILRRRAWDASV